MIISTTKKFIFIHINKNGGTSVRHALKNFHTNKFFFNIGNKVDKIIRIKILNKNILIGRFLLDIFNLILPISKKMFRYHETISTLKNFKKLDEYYKFCIIREPIDRLKSIYFFSLNKPRAALRSFAIDGINSFVKNIIKYKLVNTQWDLISINEKSVMDDYISFDNMNYDFARICTILNIDSNIFKLQHKNIGKKDSVYLTQDSIKLIKTYFQKDFELYNLSKNNNYSKKLHHLKIQPQDILLKLKNK